MVRCITILLILLVSACKPTTVPVSRETSRSDTTIIREKLVPVEVKGSSVTQKLSREQYDSLVQALKHLPKGQTIFITDPKMQTKLTLALDSIGRLVLECQTLDKTYWEKLQEKDRIITIKDIQIREQEKSFFDKVQTFMENGLWFLIIAVVLLVSFNWFIIKRR